MGPVEVFRDGCQLLLPGRTAIVVLTALLLAPDRVVPFDTLIRWRWDTALPAHPRAALHSGIARLRRLLGDDLVETVPLGYRLRADGTRLDILRFRELSGAAATALAAGAAQDALALLGQAAALWRGDPLCNVDAPALIREAVPGLTEQYLQVISQRAALCLRLGLCDVVVRELSMIAHRYPFNERPASS